MDKEPFELRTHTDGMQTLHIPSWEKAFPDVSCGFTTRNGGGSEPAIFPSLNCALHVGDLPEHVISNRKKVCAAAGFHFEAFTCGEQTHGNQAAAITRSERGRGRESQDTAILATDALVTSETDILLASFYADCVPLFFLDPVQGVIALAHAGWKGTASQIAANTIQMMVAQYGCEASHIRTAIGPSIGKCCYEVSADVATILQEIADGSQEISPGMEGHFMIDLKELNRQIMIKAGIMPFHIEKSSYCTGCQTNLFYSHRMEMGKTGRMASWIGRRQ